MAQKKGVKKRYQIRWKILTIIIIFIRTIDQMNGRIEMKMTMTRVPCNSYSYPHMSSLSHLTGNHRPHFPQRNRKKSFHGWFQSSLFSDKTHDKDHQLNHMLCYAIKKHQINTWSPIYQFNMDQINEHRCKQHSS